MLIGIHLYLGFLVNNLGEIKLLLQRLAQGHCQAEE